jgi:TfoX/Sxy family transcriptional regulator of competence genes
VVFDEALAERIRKLLAGEPELTEQRMFGGLAFLIGGNMAVAASGQGGLLVRVDPADSDALTETGNARPMEMRGHEMRGWLRVHAAEVEEDDALGRWVRRGAEYARLLPPKARES